MSWKTLIILIAIPAVLAAFLMLGDEEAIAVQTYIVEKGPVEASVANTRSGTIEACKRTKLAPAIGGQIAAIHVKEGDRVEAGKLLMELWNDTHKAKLAQAEAALKVHRLTEDSVCISAASDGRDAARFSKLAEKDLTSKDIADHATSKAEASEAQCLASKSKEMEYQAAIDLQRALLNQTYITAPFAGTIAKINGEVGEFSTPSPPGVPTPPAIDLLTADCVYLDAPIDEVDAALIRPGQPARVSLDAYRGDSFTGQVKRVSPYVEDFAKQARTVSVEVSFESGDLPFLVGYSADVEILLASQDSVLRIPTEALLENQRVWIVDGTQRVAEREVVVGIGNWKFTEIKSGLEAGDRVITSLGLSDLKPGVLVTFAE